MFGRTYFIIDVWLLIWWDLLLEVWSWSVEFIELSAFMGLSTTYFLGYTLSTYWWGALRARFNQMMLVMTLHPWVEYIFMSNLRTIDSLCVNVFNSRIYCLKSCSVHYKPFMPRLEIGWRCSIFQITTSEFIDSSFTDIIPIRLFLMTLFITLKLLWAH